MRFNSKILGVLLTLLAAALLVSATGAANLGDDFNGNGFGVKIPSGDYFTEIAKIATEDIDMEIYENSNHSADANSIIYFKDQTTDKKEISGFVEDMEKSANKVEETDKYVVLKNTENSNDFDISQGFDSIFNFIGSAFSSEGMNVSADGNSISLSSNGMKVSDANGEKVSITSEGISVSGDSSSGNASVNVSSDVNSNIMDCDYSLYLKNKGNDTVIVISGNDLAVLLADRKSVV